MKHFMITLIVAACGLGLIVPDAEAQRRMGGGSSFGMKRNVTPPPQAPRPAAQAPARQGAQPAAAPNRSWLGPVAGLAAGLGLAALFSSLGLGEEFGSFLLILLLAFGGFLLFRMLMRRSAAAGGHGANRMQYAAGSAAQHNVPAGPAGANHAFGGGAEAPAAQASGLRAQLDEESFLRQAKLNFIRLQAANDEGNLPDIREFTTPEVFAEIRMQMADSPVGPPRRTDVVELDATVLDVDEDSERYIVSVHFQGLLRDEPDAAPAQFEEIWHLTKDKAGRRGWLVAGIQQTS